MSLPNLETLLAQKLVLLLGAGASVDYGFPTWVNLRVRLLEKLKSFPSKDSLDQKMVKFWVDTIENSTTDMHGNDLTIDQIITQNYRNLVERHFVVGIMKEVLRSYEEEDTTDSKGKWISVFRKKYESLLRTAISNKRDNEVLRLLNNLRVVSLNYDRCFLQHFYPYIVNLFSEAHLQDKNFLGTRKTELTGFFTVYQPHGSLGFLSIDPIFTRIGNPIHHINSENGTSYTNFQRGGNGNKYGGKSLEHQYLELVGEGNLDENYRKINQNILSDATYCLAIGLSPVGLSGCKIDWGKFKSIFYSGKSVPISIPGNFICLDMYANAIAQLL